MTTKIKNVNFNKNAFEATAWKADSVVIGIDEVGRGCLAGPVVAAAVILPIHKDSRHLRDSKLMTHEERLKAYNWIFKRCHIGIGIIHNRIIDQHNIWQATLIAMKKAVINLLAISPQKPSAILSDAMPLNLFDTNYKDIPIHYFPKGERKSSSIAAASIVAKVTRDRMMDLFDLIIPGYKLCENKGYATKAHKMAIKNTTHSIIHRMSFLGKTLSPQNNPLEQQLLLNFANKTEESSYKGVVANEKGHIFCRSD